MTAPQVTILDNGVRVATLDMPGLETAAVGLYVDCGSRHERAEENGVAHMLEHMVFKGTRQRSARQIAEEIEAVGGALNAATGRDQTAFYARVLADDVPLGFDLLADMLTAPRFDSADMEREREVVLQELAQAIDTPDDIIFDNLFAASFTSQSLGRPVLGSEETIRALQPATVADWLDCQYRGSGLVVAAAGKVDHAALVAMAGERLGSIRHAGPQQAGKPHEAARFIGGEHRDERPLEQVHVTLGWPGEHFHSDGYYPQMLFSTALGGGMSSRLFQDLREDRGLVYSVYSFLSPFADAGLFGLYFGTGAEQAGEAAQLCIEAIKRAAETLDEGELARAKAQAKAGLFMGLESCAGQSEQIGRHLLMYDRVINTAELVEQIDGCTVEMVRASGAALLSSAALTLTSVGPSAGVPDVAALAALAA